MSTTSITSSSLNAVASALIQNFDTNGDSKVDAQEFTELLSKLLGRVGPSGSPGPAPSTTTKPTVASSNAEWGTYFSSLVAQNNLGPNATPEGVFSLQKELADAGVTLAISSSGEVRGRLYLPTGDASNPWGRPFDVVRNQGWGQSWVWIQR